jgi:flagellar biosynthesis protein FlhF
MGVGSRRLYEVTAAAPRPNPAARRLSAVEKRYRESLETEANPLAGQPETPPLEAAAPAASNETAETQKGLEYFERLVREAQERINAPKSGKPASSEFEPLVGSGARKPKEPRRSEAYTRPPQTPEEAELRMEIAEMRDLLRVLVAESPHSGMPPEFSAHYQGLVETGVTRELAARLVNESSNVEDKSLLRDPQVFDERLRFRIRRLLRTSGGIKLGPGAGHLVAFVGPTGVGKTTNLAKIAASFSVTERAKVGLITADTYRVAATDQLRVYANIIGLDMRIVKTPKAAEQAREAFSGYDLILMDTAGGSPFNDEQMDAVRGILEAAQPSETMLLCGAGTPYDDLKVIHQRFACLRPTSVLFTKLDETRRYGGMLSLAAESKLPLSYFSIGQNVPDDIVLAHGGMVADLLMEAKDRSGRASTKSA